MGKLNGGGGNPSGYCPIGVYHPKKAVNVGTLWRSAHALGAAGIFTIGRRYDRQASDTTAAFRHVPLTHYATVDDLRDHLPFGCPLIGVETTGDVPSAAYAHPERACYLLGSEDHGLPPDVLAACHAVLRLPGAYCLNVAVAGSLVLYDRMRHATARVD